MKLTHIVHKPWHFLMQHRNTHTKGSFCRRIWFTDIYRKFYTLLPDPEYRICSPYALLFLKCPELLTVLPAECIVLIAYKLEGLLRLLLSFQECPCYRGQRVHAACTGWTWELQWIKDDPWLGKPVIIPRRGRLTFIATAGRGQGPLSCSHV